MERNKHQFTKTQKINWVFKYLTRVLDPVVIGKHEKEYATSWGKEKTNIPITIAYDDCYCKTDKMPDVMPMPFSDVDILVTHKSITIIGEGMYYRFPPNFLLTLKERFNTTME